MLDLRYERAFIGVKVLRSHISILKSKNAQSAGFEDLE